RGHRRPLDDRGDIVHGARVRLAPDHVLRSQVQEAASHPPRHAGIVPAALAWDMKIVDVRPMVMGTPWRNLVIVVVRTDEGIEGVGEVRLVNNTEAVLGYLAEAVPNHVLGADPFAVESLVHRMWWNDYGRPGQIEMSGVGALEMACWDIMGKATGQPVYRLLGGPVRDRI